MTPASGGHAEAVLRVNTCMKPVTRTFAAVAAFTSEYLPAAVSSFRQLLPVATDYYRRAVSTFLSAYLGTQRIATSR
jgi:hypothetical protein